MKFFRLILILTLAAFYCGNPAIIRYLSPIQNQESKEPPGIRKYLIYNENGIKIHLQNAGMKDIEEFAILGNINRMEFRIPSLTYLKFYIENYSTKDFKINLFGIKLENSSGMEFPVISENFFREKYTSVAYSNFRYSKIFAFYTMLFQGKKAKKEQYFEMFEPAKEISIRPGYAGMQLIPFELISEQYLDYLLILPIDSENIIKIPLKYIIYRNDQRKRMANLK